MSREEADGRIEMQFAVGISQHIGQHDGDGCRVVLLADIEEACRVLGLRLHGVDDPERVEGKNYPHQWFVNVSLADSRMHFLGCDTKRLDMRDVGFHEEVGRG